MRKRLRIKDGYNHGPGWRWPINRLWVGERHMPMDAAKRIGLWLEAPARTHARDRNFMRRIQEHCNGL